MKKKGKQKKYLYDIRNNHKLFRSRYRKNKRGIVRKYNEYINEYDNFVGSDYRKVIHYLEYGNFGKSRHYPRKNKTAYIKIPEVFSVSTDAQSAIRLLQQIYSAAHNLRIEKIVFDHSHCINLGLSASTITDVIVLAVDRYRQKQGKPLVMEGSLPYNENARNVLLASGLPYHINADTPMRYDKKQVERFETIKGTHSMSANKADETATKLTNYFNKCLRTQNMELNGEGKRILSRIFGEVISNCEIHGGDQATWYTQGHYQNRSDDFYGEMQLLFLNIGETIYEGLKKDSSDETKDRLARMMKKHQKHINAGWDEEMIYTVFALQEGVSRLRDKHVEGYQWRGSGTVSMIEMFNEIGESETGLKPNMTILSGNTQIVFTDKYKMDIVKFQEDVVFGNGERKIIAFNETNDIYKPGDSENVKKISEYFPGTVISLRFYLDSRYISSLKRNG